MDNKTPGVSVQEVSLFPPGVAEMATAVPAFAGYTEFALDVNSVSLLNIPTRITSMVEFGNLFGGPYAVKNFTVKADTTKNEVIGVTPDKQFFLYEAIRLFFNNGGGPCYIVSVGDYSGTISYSELSDGIDAIQKYDEPTLIIFPDGTGLLDGSGNPDYGRYSDLQKKALAQCEKLQDRFVILDLMRENTKADSADKPVSNFRDNIGVNSLKYGAAYYPWIIAGNHIEFDFRKLKFINASGTEITDLSVFSLNAGEISLVTDIQNKITETDHVIKDIVSIPCTGIRSDGTAIISKTLQETEQKVGTDPDFKSQFTNFLNILAGMAQAFPVSDVQLPPDSLVKQDIGKLKNDPALTGALTTLAKIEKNSNVIANSLASRNAATVKAIYDQLNGPWLGGQDYDDLEPDPADETIYPANRTGCLKIIDDLNSRVLGALLNAYGTLVSSPLFYENQAALALFTSHVFFKGVSSSLTETMQTIPPSGAVAGVYATVDRTRGVWKNPANVSLNGVTGPAVRIDNQEQENLNVDASGKSINAIRAFTGKGTLIWGARTLAGNSGDWRYISVRRFFNMVEESVKKATEPFVFEPNDANTWTKVRAMIENFLTLQWRAGALQGAKPEQAFYVSVGLGATMTALDITEGRMIIEIGMAAVRPAEFIILVFSHKMMEK